MDALQATLKTCQDTVLGVLTDMLGHLAELGV